MRKRKNRGRAFGRLAAFAYAFHAAYRPGNSRNAVWVSEPDPLLCQRCESRAGSLQIAELAVRRAARESSVSGELLSSAWRARCSRRSMELSSPRRARPREGGDGDRGLLQVRPAFSGPPRSRGRRQQVSRGTFCFLRGPFMTQSPPTRSSRSTSAASCTASLLLGM